MRLPSPKGLTAASPAGRGGAAWERAAVEPSSLRAVERDRGMSSGAGHGPPPATGTPEGPPRMPEHRLSTGRPPARPVFPRAGGGPPLGIGGGGPGTTVVDDAATPAPNLLNGEFAPDTLNCAPVADMTYIPTAEGWLYPATELDCCSRKIVG